MKPITYLNAYEATLLNSYGAYDEGKGEHSKEFKRLVRLAKKLRNKLIKLLEAQDDHN